MKRFITGFINLLINVGIIVILLLLCFIAFIFFMSKTNDISFENAVSYIKSFGNDLSSSVSTDTLPSITLDYSNENNITINNIKNNKFYYNQLDDNSKIIYDALETNISNLKKDNYKINFSTKFNELLHQQKGQYILNEAFQAALDAFFYDHPELFYIDLTKITLLIKSTSIGPLTTYYVSITPPDGDNYLYEGFESEQEVNDAILKVENVRNNLILKLDNYDDYNKALTVHDTLVNSLEYDSSLSRINTYNIYGALIERKVVCEGYAKAFKYIMDSLDIECILVSGKANNSSNKTESHMWNYIKLDNNWYGVDVTWDDPIIIGNSISNRIRHDYFCKGSNVFDDDHYISTRISDKGKSFSIPSLYNKNYK